MVIDEIIRVAKENEIAFSAAGAIFMVWIGYRLTKAEGRRQEINAVSQKIFLDLNSQLKCAEVGIYPRCGISDSEFHLLGQHLSIIDRFFFSRALSKFKYAQDNCGAFEDGLYKFHSPMLLIRAIKRLKKNTKPR